MPKARSASPEKAATPQRAVAPKPIRGQGGEVVLYRTSGGGSALEVRLDRETVWLTQDQMSQLFGRDRSVISKHLQNVFKEAGLPKTSNVQKMHIPSSDKPVAFYGLDTILSVGYRVKSPQGTRFRIWATQTPAPQPSSVDCRLSTPQP